MKKKYATQQLQQSQKEMNNLFFHFLPSLYTFLHEMHKLKHHYMQETATIAH